jgi:hypothetical protein
LIDFGKTATRARSDERFISFFLWRQSDEAVRGIRTRTLAENTLKDPGEASLTRASASLQRHEIEVHEIRLQIAREQDAALLAFMLHA